MTTSEQRRWDLLTGPTQIHSTTTASTSATKVASSARLDGRIETRLAVAERRQERLQMFPEERTGLTKKVATFTEVHELAVNKNRLVSSGNVNRGLYT